jgi:O-antigen ligase
VSGRYWPEPAKVRNPVLWIVLVALIAGVALGTGIAYWSPAFAATALLVLAIAIAIFVRPELGVLGFVAVANLLPFSVIPIRFGLSFTFLDEVLTVLLIAWLFWAIWRGRSLIGSPLGFPILLYFGLAVVAFVLGLTYSISPERMRLFLKSLNSILFFFSVLNCIQSQAQLRRVVRALLLCGATAALVALALQYLPRQTTIGILSSLGPLGYPTGPEVLRPIADTDIMRATGTSVDPNVLGGLLMMVASLLIGQILSPAPVLQRKTLLLLASGVLAALVLTQSRSAFGGFVIAAVLVGTVRDRRLLLGVVAAAVAVLFLPRDWVFVDRLFHGLAFEDRASQMRLGEYKDAINLIAHYPWFGIGFGEPPSIDLYLGVSSIYLLVAQEMGLLGLASFLAVLVVLAWQVISGVLRTEDQELRWMLLSLAAALAAAGAAGLLDHYSVNIVFPHMIALFWLYVGLAAVGVRLARAKPQPLG